MARKKARISDNRAITSQNGVHNSRVPEIRTMYAIFREILDSQAHERLLTELKIEFYDTLNINEFSEDFFECMRHIMIYDDRVKTETPLLFCIRFVIMCLSKSDSDASHAKSALLLKRLVKYVTSHSDAVNPVVRLHSVQASRLLLTELSEDFPVPEILFEKIQTKLLSRFWDVKAYVRCEAVRASSRLQDPTDSKCPIVMGLMHICKFDSTYTVRLAALQALAITTKTLPCVIERIRDVADIVRKKSFELLTKWKILKPLSISSRLSIVESGLSDKSDIVKTACKELLKVWLVASENNLITLLKRFDVENMESATELAFHGLLGSLPPNEVVTLIDQLKAIMNEENLIVEDQLSAESAFLWRHLVSFVNERPDDFEGQAEKILPSVINFEQYLRRLFQKPIDQNIRKEISLDEYAEYCTIIKNLLPIVNHIDIFDTYNRTLVINLIKWAMSSVDIPFNYVDHLMKLFVHLESNNSKICDQTVELINELLYGDGDQPNNDLTDNQENRNPDLDRDVSVIMRKSKTDIGTVVNSDSLRKMKVEIAEVDVKINELKETINTGIQGNALEGLSEMISELKGLELKKKDLVECRDQIMSPVDEKVALEDEPVAEEELLVKKENGGGAMGGQTWMASGMESRIIKAHMMTIAMIKECNMLWTLPSSLRSLFNDVILVSVRHTDTCVREKAILAVGLCCLLDRDLAMRYHSVLLKSLEVDHDQVKEVAVTSLVDLFIRFGLEPFQECQLAGLEQTEPSEEEQQRCVAVLTNPIVALLSDPRTELMTAASIGLSKLLYHHKIISPKLLSRLLLIWFSPQYADNVLLKAHLGAFFTSYSLMSLDNQKSVANCFLVTMTTLFKAPASSPLTEVDASNVTEFFVRVTDAKYLLANRTSPTVSGTDTQLQENPCHDELASLLASQIIKGPFTTESKYYMPMLARLRLSAHNLDLISELDSMAVLMLDKLRDKKSLQLLTKMHGEWQKKIDVNVGDDTEVVTVVGDAGDAGDNGEQHTVVIAEDETIAVDIDQESVSVQPPTKRTALQSRGKKTAAKTKKTESNDQDSDAKEEQMESGTSDDTSTDTVASLTTGSSADDSRSSQRPKNTPTSAKKISDDDVFKKPMAIRSTRASTRAQSSVTVIDHPPKMAITRRSSKTKK